MKSYYENFPEPPEDPGPGATEEQRTQFEADRARFEEQKADYIEANGPEPEPDPVVPPAPPPAAAGAGPPGKPAARLGDMTAHGGAISAGSPTVSIGNKPAARVTDMHSCPMVTGVVPHVGGPINPPASTTVKIDNKPAARVGDQLTCTGPTDVIAQGETTVFIGG